MHTNWSTSTSRFHSKKSMRRFSICSPCQVPRSSKWAQVPSATPRRSQPVAMMSLPLNPPTPCARIRALHSSLRIHLLSDSLPELAPGRPPWLDLRIHPSVGRVDRRVAGIASARVAQAGDPRRTAVSPSALAWVSQLRARDARGFLVRIDGAAQ